MQIYEPAEDSYLLQKSLIVYLNNLIQDNKKYKFIDSKKIKILDMGSGSGIQAETCFNKGFKNVFAADINQKAIIELKKKKLKTIQTDLFKNINKTKKFDLIVFNSPYLPENKYDKGLDTTAGKKGYEIIVKFLKQAKDYLNKNGKILLLFSTLSKPKIILKNAEKFGYKYTLLDKKRLFFEQLYVYIFFL